MRNCWIISVGTELCLGQTVDTNAAWLADRLAAIGVAATRHITVADEFDDIRDAVLEAARLSDMTLVTGGLGPTEDDLTRQATAAAAGLELERHAPTVEHLRAFFAARGREMPERNLIQAMMPRGARVLGPVAPAVERDHERPRLARAERNGHDAELVVAVEELELLRVPAERRVCAGVPGVGQVGRFAAIARIAGLARIARGGPVASIARILARRLS